MIILVGESASGKSTVEKILGDKYGYIKTVSYTTRPKRNEEVNGKDYNFISDEEFTQKFNDNFFVEVGAYNGWLYGTTKEQYTEKTVCVLTPHGLRQIKKNLLKTEKLNIKIVYINVERRNRLIKILQRGDNIEEAIRRNQSDVGQYDGIEDEVDYIINNNNYEMSPEEVAERIVSLVNET